MNKGATLIVVLIVLLSALSMFAFAEINVPESLTDFYNQDISNMVLSNSSFVLYNSDDRGLFYHMYYNPQNDTLNVTTTISCISKKCPAENKLVFDYMQNDETQPYVKKAVGVYILTNGSSLGDYQYELLVVDKEHTYSQKANFTITIISKSLWKQFWHNLFAVFGF